MVVLTKSTEEFVAKNKFLSFNSRLFDDGPPATITSLLKSFRLLWKSLTKKSLEIP